MLWGCAACLSSKWISFESTQSISADKLKGWQSCFLMKELQRLSKFSATYPVRCCLERKSTAGFKLILIRKICLLQFWKNKKKCHKMCRPAHSAWLKINVYFRKKRPLSACLRASQVCILLSSNIFSIFPFTTCFSCSRCAGISSRIPCLPSPCVKIDWNKKKLFWLQRYRSRHEQEEQPKSAKLKSHSACFRSTLEQTTTRPSSLCSFGWKEFWSGL